VQFTETKLAGAYLIDLERREDARGFFARAFCRREMTEHGLVGELVQCNVAFTRLKGTIRGLHYQVPPAAEVKVVGCIRGAVLDVIVDLRPGSATYLKHLGVELTAESGRQLYVPHGFSHGYQSLTDEAEVLYFVSAFHSPECERGHRYDDPNVGIEWPEPATLVSAKDLNWPPLNFPEDRTTTP
jgi:dTDP-4-dehydrorhamnose 3,5-epimerase